MFRHNNKVHILDYPAYPDILEAPGDGEYVGVGGPVPGRRGREVQLGQERGYRTAHTIYSFN